MNTKVWNRAEIKERAQKAFKRSYWWCVLAALILMLVSGESRATNGAFKSKEEKQIEAKPAREKFFLKKRRYLGIIPVYGFLPRKCV